ncbi:hypothetical protein JYT83_00050 [bacterium AH-315-F18]|nr:hypothetical protein [bacterium AH-315-F18]
MKTFRDTVSKIIATAIQCRTAMVCAIAVSLTSMGCMSSIVRSTMKSPDVMNATMEEMIHQVPQMARLILTASFAVVLDEVVIGKESKDPDVRAFSEVVAKYFFGELTGHNLHERVKGQELLFGKGHTIFVSYAHSQEGTSKFAVVDSFGSLTMWAPDVLGGVEVMSFSVESANHVVDFRGDVFSVSFELLPLGAKYGSNDTMTKRWKDVVFQLGQLKQDKEKDESEQVSEFNDYLRKLQGVLGPIIRIDFQLERTQDGSFFYTYDTRHPVYIRLPTQIVSARPELMRAVKKINADDPKKLQMNEDMIDVRLGYVLAKASTTGNSKVVIPPKMLSHRKRARIPELNLSTPK